MSTGTILEPVSILKKAKDGLQLIASTTETQVQSVALAFKELAAHADTILSLAAAIIGCVEDERVSSILPKVQSLGNVARQFIGQRLQVTTGILDTVATEVEVLRQLSQVTAQQGDIALKTKALSVLTNVEVAHLGGMGTGFQYLAHELANFSRSLIDDALALENRTDSRRASILKTKLVLSSELPRLREKLAVIEDLANLDSSLNRLSRTPAQFKMGVEYIAQQIAGVVSAIQAHDITRQQSEHVEQAFALISERMGGAEDSEDEVSQVLPQAYAGLTIQIYQLKSIKRTVETWTTQIKACMDGILRVSASEMVGIGPLVQGQEQDVSSQLAHIELLEQESQSYCARIQQTLEGLFSLMQFVGEHVQRSKSVRERLRLLSFNSIIEANQLGAKADTVLAIAKTIQEISADWSLVTDRSGHAMKEMQTLVDQTKTMMEAFSEASNERLREAQAQTRIGLENLRAAAAFAAEQSQKMEIITAQMQAKSAEVEGAEGFFDARSAQMEAILVQLESLKSELENDHPDAKRMFDEKETERLYSAGYTTEIEREIMRAALRGEPLPVAHQTLSGNSVELF